MQTSSMPDMETNLSDAELIEIGRARLYEDHLIALGQKFNSTRDAYRAASDEARAAVVEDAGKTSEVQLGKLMRVDRMTIRAWLGKPRARKAAET